MTKRIIEYGVVPLNKDAQFVTHMAIVRDTYTKAYAP